MGLTNVIINSVQEVFVTLDKYTLRCVACSQIVFNFPFDS